MKRDEVLGAWAFPERVTWFRRDGKLYEGWFFGKRRAYLVNGMLFDWMP